jgi:hypothetical protein
MKKEEILKKAIEKAVENGWELRHVEEMELKHYRNIIFNGQMEDFLFNHSFAKAFWGENKVIMKRYKQEDLLSDCAWQHHIQQLALAEDRLEYISRFL